MTFLFSFATHPSNLGRSGTRALFRLRRSQLGVGAFDLDRDSNTVPLGSPAFQPRLAEYMVSKCATIMQSYPAEAPTPYHPLPASCRAGRLSSDGGRAALPATSGKPPYPLVAAEPRLRWPLPDTLERVLDQTKEVLIREAVAPDSHGRALAEVRIHPAPVRPDGLHDLVLRDSRGGKQLHDDLVTFGRYLSHADVSCNSTDARDGKKVPARLDRKSTRLNSSH